MGKSRMTLGLYFRSVSVVQLHPGVYPVLMILGRLCPSVAEGSSSTLNLEQLLPFIIRSAYLCVIFNFLFLGRP